MTINDLNIGSRVLFGAVRFEGLADDVHDILWIKADPNNTLIASEFVSRMAADAPEPDNSSRDRRERGSNFFPQSNLLQWLNATGENWFTPAHDTDVAPEYSHFPGFLSDFATWERDVIVPHEICTVVPDGFRREFGVLHHMNCLVSIPSIHEIYGASEDVQQREGEQLAYYAVGNARPRCFLRTAIASTLQCIDQYGDPASRAASQRYFIVPKICVKSDALVADQPDSDGYYRILPPDGNESCINVSDLFEVLAQ